MRRYADPLVNEIDSQPKAASVTRRPLAPTAVVPGGSTRPARSPVRMDQ
jgi:hypothetical protein